MSFVMSQHFFSDIFKEYVLGRKKSYCYFKYSTFYGAFRSFSILSHSPLCLEQWRGEPKSNNLLKVEISLIGLQNVLLTVSEQNRITEQKTGQLVACCRKLRGDGKMSMYVRESKGLRLRIWQNQQRKMPRKTDARSKYQFCKD